MPKIAVYKNLVFFLYAYDLAERAHLHVSNNKRGRARSAKIWLDNLEIFEKGNLSSRELKEAQHAIATNLDAIAKQISNFAEGKDVMLLNLNR
jgi:Domain of unknown function (DUF4160)